MQHSSATWPLNRHVSVRLNPSGKSIANRKETNNPPNMLPALCDLRRQRPQSYSPLTVPPQPGARGTSGVHPVARAAAADSSRQLRPQLAVAKHNQPGSS